MPDNNPLSIKEEHLEKICEQYDKLLDEIILHDDIIFYHFNIDINGVPCIYKRISGCGAGFEYIAVTPEGDIYPCHQFVGNESFIAVGVAKLIIIILMEIQKYLMKLVARFKRKGLNVQLHCNIIRIKRLSIRIIRYIKNGGNSMNQLKYVYGPVPSRRLGESLGISPIPKKTCNYSCIYCQLGRTDKLSNVRKEFFSISDIIDELKINLDGNVEFDVITIVGEGEPTLYLKIGELICKIKEITDKPVAVITNGALMYDKRVQNELGKADIVLPSLDAYDEDTFKKINRPYGKLNFMQCYDGLVEFSNNYKGELWIEIMLIEGINEDTNSLLKFKSLLKKITYNKLYVNTPVRPPAEEYVKAVSRESMNNAIEILGGISIDSLVSIGFKSEIEDDYEAILSIIKRHPMNQFEITSFLNSRKCKDVNNIIERLNQDNTINHINYKGFITYRLK